MKLRLFLLSILTLCSAFGQTIATLTLNATASLVSRGPNFTLSGTASISGVGDGTLNGAGTIPNAILTGSQSGPIPGTFTITFQGGDVLYGTFSIPSGLIFTSVGGSTGATGSVTIQGGSTRLENVRGFFPAITGTGTALTATSTSLQVSGSGLYAANYRILPQIAFGGGWYSALYFSNATTSPTTIILNFFADNGTPLTIPAFGTSSTQVSIPAGGSARVEIPNSGSLVQGYATTNLIDGITGYGVFRQSVAGIPDQEAVVPLGYGLGTSATLTFDDTTYVTGVALANPSDTATTVTVVAKSSNGGSLGTTTLSLPPRNKRALVLRDLPGLSGIAGSRGFVTFTVTAGNLSALGLRFNGSAFTSIPTER